RARIEALHWGACVLPLLPVVLRMAPAFLGKEFSAGPEREGMAFVMHDFKGTSTTVWLHAYAGVIALVLAALGSFSWRRAAPALALAVFSFLLSMGPALALGDHEIPLP